MAFLSWTSNMSVGNDHIDSQHQRLIEILNELVEAMTQRRAKEVIGKILDDMADYTVKHFRDEESLMEKGSYPELAEHKKIHAAFVSKVAEFKEGLENGKLALSLDLMNFLKDWLLNHIMKEDRKYMEYI